LKRSLFFFPQKEKGSRVRRIRREKTLFVCVFIFIFCVTKISDNCIFCVFLCEKSDEERMFSFSFPFPFFLHFVSPLSFVLCVCMCLFFLFIPPFVSDRNDGKRKEREEAK